MKKYTIKTTVHGPCIITNDDMFFISDGVGFNELIDQEPELIFDIHQAMIAQLQYESTVMIDSLVGYKRHDPMKVRAALDALMVYHRFIYQEYPDYRSMITKAIAGEINHENVYEINPDHINRFYALLGGDVQ